jgi:hypothetical protein
MSPVATAHPMRGMNTKLNDRTLEALIKSKTRFKTIIMCNNL